MDSFLVREGKLFSVFVVLGAIKWVMAVALSALIIDFLGVPALPGSVLVVILVLMMTYLLSVGLRLIKPKFRVFALATVLFGAAHVVMTTALVDAVGLPGSLSTGITVFVLFVARFFFFRSAGII